MSFDHEWHVALNKYNSVGGEFRHWMYEAKNIATESVRLARLFKLERTGQLPKVHRQCSLSQTEKVEDNHLSCCLGNECRKCPHLLALDSAKLTPEEIDQAKAWTCVSHILHTAGSGQMIDTSEGYLLAEDDKMFWSNVYESMSNHSMHPDDKEQA